MSLIVIGVAEIKGKTKMIMLEECSMNIVAIRHLHKSRSVFF